MRPPDSVQPSELFLKLQEAPAPSEVFDFPRKGIADKIRVYVLTMEQHHQARLMGQEWLAGQKVSKEAKDGYAAQAALSDRISQEVIAMSVHADVAIQGSESTGTVRYRRIFANANDVGKLTPDEIRALFAAYVLVQHKYGPHLGDMSAADLTAWMQRLAEGASANPLAQLDSQDLAELTLTLAKRAYTLSATVACLRSSLPPTLASALESLGIGITSFGLPHVDIAIRSELEPLMPTEPAPATAATEQAAVGIPTDKPLDTAGALALAKELYGSRQ